MKFLGENHITRKTVLFLKEKKKEVSRIGQDRRVMSNVL